MRKAVAVTIFAGLVILLALLFGAGWGCKSSVPPETTEVGTRETSPEESSDSLTYRNEEFGFEFQYPSNWRLITFDEAPSRVGLIAPDNPAAGGQEALPEISVILQSNPERLAIQEYYAQAQEPIFEDAAGGVNSILVNDYSGFSLEDVLGEVTVDMVVLAHTTSIAEFELTRDEYRAVFDILINSFLFLGGE
jgi:hypothetical protein